MGTPLPHGKGGGKRVGMSDIDARISRKRWEIRRRTQWATYRKAPMGYRLASSDLTLDDLEGQSSRSPHNQGTPTCTAWPSICYPSVGHVPALAELLLFKFTASLHSRRHQATPTFTAGHLNAPVEEFTIINEAKIEYQQPRRFIHEIFCTFLYTVGSRILRIN